MSRTDIDRGDEVALRGVVAHEYAHIIDPRQRRDICVGAIGCGVPGALAVTLFGLELVLVSAVSSTPLWVPRPCSVAPTDK